MTDTTRSHRQLGAVVLAGFIALASVLLFPSPPRHEGRADASFSIALRTDREGAAQLYYDIGGGFAERLSSRIDLKPGPGMAEYEFALPAGKVEGLRFDPIDKDGTVTLARAAIKDSAGKLLVALSPEDFVASQQIAQLDRNGDEVTIRTVDGGNDPALLLKLRGPLVLAAAAPDETRQADQHAAGLQRGLAAGLCVVGIALGWLVWRAVRMTGITAPPTRELEIAAVVWAGLCILYSRRPDVLTCPQFWAEDGTIFFAQQHALGWKAALLTHGGYLHFIPRLTAGLADLVGAGAAPLLYLSAALLVVVIAIGKATSRRIELPYPYWCGLAAVLVPNMDEIAFNLTNAQWFGAVVLLLVTCSRPPATRGELIRDLTAVIVFGLSGPFSVFFLPLFVARALRWRTPSATATAALVAVTSVIQIVAYRFSAVPPSSGGQFSALHALAAMGYRTGGQLLNVMPPPLVTDPIAWGICALGLWLLLWLAAPVAQEFRVTRLILLSSALLVLAGGVWRYRETVDVFFNRIHVQRYLHLPLVATFWLLLATVRNTVGWKKAAFIAIGLAVLVRNASWYRVVPNLSYDWPRYAAKIDRGEKVEAPINPPGWVLPMPLRKQE